MVDKVILKKVLDQALATGADFADIFIENTYSNNIELNDSKVKSALTSISYGAGIRILNGLEEVYGYTNEVDEEGLMKLATKLASSFGQESKNIQYELIEEKYNNHKIIKNSKDYDIKEKVKLVEKADTARAVDPRIVQVVATLLNKTQDVLIANTHGKLVKDTRNHVRISIEVVAKENDIMENSFDSAGANQGFEFFDNVDIVEMAKRIAGNAIESLSAENVTGGVYPVVIHNAFGGVIFHEACGHSLEATSVSKGLSVFCNKIGQKIASDIVTAIDDGTVENGWGSANIDDEGTPTRKNVLIENGVLKSYLVDYKNSLRMKSDINGCSRRQSYRFSPTSRMSNTYIANGKSTFEEIISNTKYGLFAKSLGGGSVNPTTGEYNFAVKECFLIEDGKLTKRVKGATLIGNGKDTLLNIDMVGNNQTFGHGVCGSLSGSIPANVGQPTIRVSNMTVGGSGGKK